MAHQFYILDVFAESKYAGNQLAVVLDFDRRLSAEQMQTIALEMNYSETTFILSDQPANGGYDVRIFTPAAEVPFAGHPTLGTAYVIQDKLEGWKNETITLNLKAGQIPVTRATEDNKTILWLKALHPEFADCFKPEDFTPILNLSIDDFDSQFPIQAVSTGLPFFIIPLKTLDAVQRAKTNLDVFGQFLETRDTAKATLIFCPQTVDSGNHLHARMFADFYGVVEDPATGSANSCLAAYLAKHEYFGSSTIDVRVEQGYEINRPSLLHLKASIDDNQYDILVGGRCILTAEGKLLA